MEAKAVIRRGQERVRGDIPTMCAGSSGTLESALGRTASISTQAALRPRQACATSSTMLRASSGRSAAPYTVKRPLRPPRTDPTKTGVSPAPAPKSGRGSPKQSPKKDKKDKKDKKVRQATTDKEDTQRRDAEPNEKRRRPRERGGNPDDGGDDSSSSSSTSSRSSDKKRRKDKKEDKDDRRRGRSPSRKRGVSSGRDTSRSSSSSSGRSWTPVTKKKGMKVSTFTVPAFPKIGQLPGYKLAVIENVTAACHTEDYTKVTEWIMKVDKVGTKFEDLAEPGKGFNRLDRKLAAALTPTIEGELARRILIKKRQQLNDQGVLISGRQVLWMVYDHFRTNKRLGLVYTITDLAKVEWLGDEKLAQFRNNWEDRVCSMATEIDDDTLANVLCDHLMTSKELREAVNKWRKLDEGVPDERAKKTYRALLDLIDDHLMYNQEIRNRSSLDRHSHHNHPTAPASEGQGKGGGGSKGKGKSGKGGKGKSGKADGKGNRKGDDGKGKGKTQGYCAFFQVGNCSMGTACRYKHDKAPDEATRERLKEIREKVANAGGGARSRSPSPQRNGKKVCPEYAMHQTCKYGDRCKFVHNHQAGMPASNADGGADQGANRRRGRSPTPKAKRKDNGGGNATADQQ